MKRILITGHKGYIGGELFARLAERHSVEGADLLDDLKSDLSNPHFILRLAERGPFDIVYNLAGMSGEAACKRDLQAGYTINADVPALLARALPADLLVQASSCSVLGLRDRIDQPYAWAKERAEWHLAKVKGCSVYRFGTVYGVPTMGKTIRWDLALNRMVHEAIHKGRVHVDGPERMRPWVNVNSLVSNLIAHPAAGLDRIAYAVDFHMSLGDVGRKVAGVLEVDYTEAPCGDDRRDYCAPAEIVDAQLTDKAIGALAIVALAEAAERAA